MALTRLRFVAGECGPRPKVLLSERQGVHRGPCQQGCGPDCAGCLGECRQPSFLREKAGKGLGNLKNRKGGLNRYRVSSCKQDKIVALKIWGAPQTGLQYGPRERTRLGGQSQPVGAASLPPPPCRAGRKALDYPAGAAAGFSRLASAVKISPRTNIRRTVLKNRCGPCRRREDSNALGAPSFARWKEKGACPIAAEKLQLPATD